MSKRLSDMSKEEALSFAKSLTSLQQSLMNQYRKQYPNLSAKERTKLVNAKLSQTIDYSEEEIEQVTHDQRSRQIAEGKKDYWEWAHAHPIEDAQRREARRLRREKHERKMAFLEGREIQASAFKHREPKNVPLPARISRRIVNGVEVPLDIEPEKPKRKYTKRNKIQAVASSGTSAVVGRALNTTRIEDNAKELEKYGIRGAFVISLGSTNGLGKILFGMMKALEVNSAQVFLFKDVKCRIEMRSLAMKSRKILSEGDKYKISVITNKKANALYIYKLSKETAGGPLGC